jgi:hypothetical protein
VEHGLVAGLEAVQEVVDGNADYRVCEGAQEFMQRREAIGGVIQEETRNEEEEETVEEAEGEGNHRAVDGVFHVDRKAYAGGEIADDAFGDAVDSEGMVGEAVLEEADSSASERAGDLAAAGDGEEDGRDEREIEIGGVGKGFRQQRLQDEAHQRCQYRDGGVKAVLIEFASGGVTEFCHYCGGS